LEDLKKKLANQPVEEEIKRLRLLSGEEPIFGEGIELTLSIAVDEFWLNDIVAQLVSSGAEAISVNDVRLLPATAGFRRINSGILMRSEYLRPVFRLVAIGPQRVLQQSIGQNGGILDRMSKAYPYLKVFLTPREKVVIPTNLL
jgi:uncharacterized protein YlxW (UPF0749 family)